MMIAAGSPADRLLHTTMSLARFVGGANIVLGGLGFLSLTVFHEEIARTGREWLDLARILPVFILPGALYFGAAQAMLRRQLWPVIALLVLCVLDLAPLILYVGIFLGEFPPLALFLAALLTAVLTTLTFDVRLLMAIVALWRRDERQAATPVPATRLSQLAPPPKTSQNRLDKKKDQREKNDAIEEQKAAQAEAARPSGNGQEGEEVEYEDYIIQYYPEEGDEPPR